MPIDCRTMASSPEVTCSPEETTASYSRQSYWAESSRPPLSCRSLKPQACSTSETSWLVAPAMAETTTAQAWPASTSRFT